MKRILNLYIVREVMSLFLMGIVIFTLILLMGRLIKMTELIISRGVPVATVGRMILYMMPSFLVFTLPMAFLLAVLLAFGRLSADNEVTVMKSCGMSLVQLMPPVLACALVAAAISLLVGVVGVPWGNTAFKQLSFQVLKQNVFATICEKVFWDEIPGIVLYSDHVDDQCLTLKDVLIHDGREPERLMTIFAKEGYVQGGKEQAIRIVLTNGSIHSPGKGDEYRQIHFGEYIMSIATPGSLVSSGFNETDMTVTELLAGISDKKIAGQGHFKLLTELHSRFSFPCATVVFGLMAVPLGIQNRRSGKSAGFSLSIGVLLIYYLMLSFLRSVAEQGHLPAVLAMWLPNIVFMLLGWYLLDRASNERRVMIPGLMGAVCLFRKGWRR